MSISRGLQNTSGRSGSLGRALALALAAGAPGALASRAWAGGTEENAFIIIDPSSSMSMYVGNYYKNARNIPDTNVLYIEPDSTNYLAFVNNVLPGLAGQVKNVRLEDHIDYVVVTPGNSFFVSAGGYVTDGCSAVTRFSMSSAFAMAFITGDILPGGRSSQDVNKYWSTAASSPPVGFDSNTAWLNGSASTSASARRYYIGAMLGWVDPPGTPTPLGNTVPQILAMIDRSVSADGTRPTGTFYYMNNTADPIRNVRACGNTQGCSGTPTLYNTAVSTLAGLGASGLVINGVMPVGHFDALGVMTGAEFPDIELTNWGGLPGYFADHLTSYAARLDLPNQRKVSAWIRMGASGSSGTVEEPCNYPGKFPHSRFFPYYVQGMTLGEAYLRNQQYTPFQNLLYGDPLTRPFTYIPDVNVAGVPGGVVSGTVVLTPSATTDKPSTAIAGFDLLIDGVLHSSTTPGGTFTIDTTRLDDGWHDLRVLAFDNTITKSVGRWVGSFTTGNDGRSVALNALTGSGDLATNYQFGVTPSGGGVSEVRLLLNGKVIGSAPGGGTISVKGQSIGAGAVNVQAEAIYADGSRARSPRVPVNISYSNGTPSGAAPVAFSYTKTVVRDSPFVVELPASLDTDPAGATYTIVTPPAQATVTSTTKGFRLLKPVGTPCGTDTLVFNVTTANGTSNNATVTIVYTAPYKPCPADFNNDGFVDGIDYDQFNNAFEAGNISADYNNDCFVDGIDYDRFNVDFEGGC